MNTIELNKIKETRKYTLNVRTITMTAMLSAISYVLAFLEFPVPLSPAFARMDLSDFPALIGAFAYGPVVGIMIELVKNGLQLLGTSTGGVGELAMEARTFLRITHECAVFKVPSRHRLLSASEIERSQ